MEKHALVVQRVAATEEVKNIYIYIYISFCFYLYIIVIAGSCNDTLVVQSEPSYQFHDAVGGGSSLFNKLCKKIEQMRSDPITGLEFKILMGEQFLS